MTRVPGCVAGAHADDVIARLAMERVGEQGPGRDRVDRGFRPQHLKMLRVMDGDGHAPLRRLRDRLMRERRRAALEEGVSDADLLALLAFETGALLACQDPRILMAEEGVDLVWRNIAAGNLAALAVISSERTAGTDRRRSNAGTAPG